MSKRIKERIQIGEDANGKPIYEWIDGYNRQELFVRAAEVLQRYDKVNAQPEQNEPHTPYFAAYLEEWWRLYKLPKLRHTTRTSYRNAIDLRILPFFKGMRLEDINTNTIQAFYNKHEGMAHSSIHQKMLWEAILMKDLNDMLKQMTVYEYRMDQGKKPSLLEKMSKWDQTERICLKAVRENSHALKYVSKRIVNYEICKEAVMNNGLALMYVPQAFRTIELCEMAVMRNGEAILFVPEELLSKEICEKAVRRNPNAFAHIPNKYKSSDLCFDVVKRIPDLIYAVPNQKKSKSLCQVAVSCPSCGIQPERHTEMRLICVSCRFSKECGWRISIRTPFKRSTISMRGWRILLSIRCP